MAKYKLRYWYEWGERDCFFWADDDATKKAFGVDVSYLEMDKLPLSEALKEYLRQTASLHDCSLNWEYPPDPPEDWTPEMEAEFRARAQEGFRRAQAELGEDFEIIWAV